MSGLVLGRGGRPASGRMWAYAAAALGGLVSIAANIAHTYVPPAESAGLPAAELDAWSPPAGAVALSVFWPVALFAAVEVIARNPWPAGWRWVALRWAGLVPVAAVAALVSYRHLSGLMRFYREDALTAAVGPLAVDGLMVMATAALIATSAHRGGPARPVTVARDEAAELGAVLAGRASTGTAGGQDAAARAEQILAAGRSVPMRMFPDAPAELILGRPAGPAAGTVTNPVTSARRAGGARGGGAGTAERVARLRERHPDWTVAQVAERAGVSARTARRHLNAPAAADTSASTRTTGTPATDGSATKATDSTEGTEAA